MPHLNNEQNKHANPIISRQDFHLTQPCPLEEKQTNNHTNKNSAQISPYMKITQTTGQSLGGQKSKRRKNSNLIPGKRRPKHNTLKKKKKDNEKAKKYYTN